MNTRITNYNEINQISNSIKNGETIETGRWYYLDTMYGMDHFDFCGTEDYPTSFEEFYFGIIATANSR